VPLGDCKRLFETARAVVTDRPRPLPVGAPFTLDAMCRATLDVYRELI
jgi:hypothetical protein